MVLFEKGERVIIGLTSKQPELRRKKATVHQDRGNLVVVDVDNFGGRWSIVRDHLRPISAAEMLAELA